MIFKSSLFLVLVFEFTSLFAQQPTQTIKGHVMDKSSNKPIEFANVSISTINKGTTTDSLGNFILNNVPIGTYNILFSTLGYEPFTMNEVLVISAKEPFLNVQLKENTTLLNEIVVKPRLSKESALNQNASVSAKMLSVEEASRFAGGFDDPARLVSSFAGVSSNVGNNGISVRGNNPKYLQWRLEGIEIPNPNHFADNATFGGGVLSALSSHNLGNSDFFSGAFPSEYSNALSGVFDMNIRQPKRGKKERTFQFGIIGIDYAEEGSFLKDGKSHYLFNSRYSTLNLIRPILPEDGGKGVEYQDMSFKLIFPTKKAGIFSAFGIGLRDFTGLNAKTDTSEWETVLNKQEHTIKMYMGTVGLNHKLFLNDKIYLRSTLAATTNGLNFTIDQLKTDGAYFRDTKVKHQLTNLIFNSFLNTKFSVKHTNKTGVIITNMMYDLKLDKLSKSIVNESGNSFLINAYTNSNYFFNNNLSVNIGLNSHFFTLNENYTIEPRIGFKYQFTSKQTLSIGYGLHSQLEKLNYYFARNTDYGNTAVNKNLDFTKSHHVVLGYDLNITENVHLKLEPYYQYLFNVPVIADSSFSFINLTNDWFFNRKLENTGIGRNYGIDLSLDKYLTKGFYYSVTASLFNSEYQGGDNVWRNTRFNRNYTFNFLAGKEWFFGKSDNKSFGANIRFSYQGGDRYSPINASKSKAKQEVIFDETKAFSKQLTPALTTHFTVLFRVNKKKTTSEWAIKVINASQYKEFYEFVYSFKNQNVEQLRRAVMVPNLSYKIIF
jgi:hypothetical protein